MKAGLRPVLLMETVICDSKLSQLSFSTTSAHSMNAQPSSKEKKSSFGGRKKGKAQKKGPDGFSAQLFSTLEKGLFLFGGVGTSQMCAAKSCMQMGMLAYTDADNTMQHRAQPQHL